VVIAPVGGPFRNELPAPGPYSAFLNKVAQHVLVNYFGPLR